MASAQHLEACDFTGATTLVPVGGAAVGTSDSAAYYLPCSTAGERIYLSCSVDSHCELGQKLSVQVSTTARVFSPADGTTLLLHSDSLRRVMMLLGYRQEASSGFAYLERGYGSDEAAAASLDMIWCLESHCPASALDWDEHATEASCRATVHNLAGYVSRKRPTPQFGHAEAYYMEALRYEPSHCPSLSYLSELYLMTNNATAATAAALRLCDVCGASSSNSLQARAAFDGAALAWPCREGAPPPPGLPPETILVVRTELTIDSTVEEFDGAAFTRAFAAAVGVPSEAVSVLVQPGSIVVVASVRADSADAAAAIAFTIKAVTSAPLHNLTASLGVPVIAVGDPVVDVAPVSQWNRVGDSLSSEGAQGGLLVPLAASLAAAAVLLISGFGVWRVWLARRHGVCTKDKVRVGVWQGKQGKTQSTSSAAEPGAQVSTTAEEELVPRQTPSTDTVLRTVVG